MPIYNGRSVLRIFITQVAAGAKNSSAKAVNDLETVAGKTFMTSGHRPLHDVSVRLVGSYDDTILRQIDTLASEAIARGACYNKSRDR